MNGCLVIGGSKGLGKALCEGLTKSYDVVWCVSRSKPVFDDSSSNIKWIKADLSNSEKSSNIISSTIGKTPIKLLVYNAGIWEQKKLRHISTNEIQEIISVNLTSLLCLVSKISSNLVKITGSNLILIGSTCGLENEGAQVSAYVATKFAMRGVAHALREDFRDEGVKVTCISPGSMATELNLNDGIEKALKKHKSSRIPLADMLSIINCIISLSEATCIKEIVVPATLDKDV